MSIESKNIDVDIDGEMFSLVEVPHAGSQLVQRSKENLLGSLDLASLVIDLGKLGNFMRIAYNGVAGSTALQIEVQRVGYKITKLADKSAVTVHSFKNASTNVLQELQGTYEFLLEGLEEMALETLSLLSTVADNMAKAAEELHKDFNEAEKDVIKALEDTQTEKGCQEDRKKKMKEEQQEFEMMRQKAEALQRDAIEAEETARKYYEQAQQREDKALDSQGDILKGIGNAITGFFGGASAVIGLTAMTGVVQGSMFGGGASAVIGLTAMTGVIQGNTQTEKGCQENKKRKVGQQKFETMRKKAGPLQQDAMETEEAGRKFYDEALEDTQTEKDCQENKKKKMKVEQQQLEMRRKKAEALQRDAMETEEAARKFYDEAQQREAKAVDSQGNLLMGNAAVMMMKQVENIVSNSAYKEAMKNANSQKLRHLDDMKQQREIRRKANEECIEFAEKIKNCKDEESLTGVAIEALHSSIGALKSLSATMMNAALFWRQVQKHCQSLAKDDVKKLVEKAMKYPEEKRIKVWTSTAFKRKAVGYYSQWVALDDVCGGYMLQIKETRKNLYEYLQENPSIEESRERVRRLAASFSQELKLEKEKIAVQQTKENEKIKALGGPN